MVDAVKGFLEVGLDDGGQVVVNHPDLKPDADGVGHIVFSPWQARAFAELLLKHAAQAERDARAKSGAARQKAAEAIPFDLEVLLRQAAEATRVVVRESYGVADTNAWDLWKRYPTLEAAQMALAYAHNRLRDWLEREIAARKDVSDV